MEADMTDDQTGGPAFPYEDHGQKGMTLRDYFAAKAMQAAIQHHGVYDETQRSGLETTATILEYHCDAMASTAYVYADAMLKARDEVAVGRKIEELGLLVKTENCLKADGICTVEQLTKLTSNHLLKIPNMGRKSVREIEQALFMQGLRLRDGQP
jgi:DNA-directed RNA polymerase alpha subunit